MTRMQDLLFPAEQLEEETSTYAQSLAAGAAEAIGSIKLAVNRGIDRPLREGLEIERELVEPLFDNDESREGIAAFREGFEGILYPRPMAPGGRNLGLFVEKISPGQHIEAVGRL